MTLLLLKNAHLYDPAPQGTKDLLVGAERILAVADSIAAPVGLEVEVRDLEGGLALPGLIDGHVHIAGAGGEGGPATRTPEVSARALFEAGVTTVVGMLGTDGYTRSVRSVLMKAKGLHREGASCVILTGAYQIPPPTITGSVATDLAFIEEVVGVGEVAVSDHRSSFPSVTQLVKLAGEARVGAMLGGKAGVVCVHLGDAPEGVGPIEEAVKVSQLPLSQFLPAHCNRTQALLDMCKNFAKQGGRIDLTTGAYRALPDVDVKPSVAVKELLDAGVPVERITASSDGQGSLPKFDTHGKLCGLTIASSKSLLQEIRDMVRVEGLEIADAFSLVTRNVADVWGLSRKGRLRPGCDADILVLDSGLRVRSLIARGRVVVTEGSAVAGGMFERTDD